MPARPARRYNLMSCPSVEASRSFIFPGIVPDRSRCWHPGRMLFAGDVATNLMGLGDPVGFENLEEGRASQRKVASLFIVGHGKPIAQMRRRGSATSGGKKLAD